MTTLVDRADAFGDRVATIDGAGAVRYDALLSRARALAGVLLAGAHDLHEVRVGVLVTPGTDWVVAMWAAWAAGAIAVPLSPQHPPAEWDYVLGDAAIAVVLVDDTHAEALMPVAQEHSTHVIRLDAVQTVPATPLPAVDDERRAMILYTSGTTGKPKGVVHTHGSLLAQVDALRQAWGWTADDHTLLVLPLHHVHGIVNVVCCALASGACVTMLPKFDAAEVWRQLRSGHITLFHAVPTIWARLLTAYDQAAEDDRMGMRSAVAHLRLIVSGSAALPVRVLERWRDLSGHTLLERYGMTELGMALSNPLQGVRVPGHVGQPLPGVEVRTVDDSGRVVPGDVGGELEVRGPAVMKEYWRRPDETAAAFHDGWFRTGDVAVLDDTDGGPSWRLLGRRSTDIIKTGGYKVSALEIEEVLREHPAVAECAALGLEDAEWGERVAVAVEVRGGHVLTLDDVRRFLKDRLAVYKVPSAMVTPEALPRNAMGKVVKGELRRLFT